MAQPISNILKEYQLIAHFCEVVESGISNPNQNVMIEHQILPNADVLKLMVSHSEHGQIIIDHLFANGIGSIKLGEKVKKTLQPQGKDKWAIYIRDDQLLTYCERVLHPSNLECDELELIRQNRALVKVTPVIPLYGSQIKGIDYFLQQIEDPVDCRMRRQTPRGASREIYWDPTDGESRYRNTAQTTATSSKSKPAGHEFTKKEPFSLLPANGKMKLVNTGGFGMNRGYGIGLLFDLALSYLKRSKYTGNLNYIFTTDAATNNKFWLGGYRKDVRVLHRAVSLQSLIDYNNNGKEKSWNELLACVSQKGFRAIFAYVDNLENRLNLLFYKIYLEKKYPFILKKFPLGIPLLIITPNEGAKKYAHQDQILDLCEGIALGQKYALDIDKTYFIQYIERYKESLLSGKNINVSKALAFLHDPVQINRYINTFKTMYKFEQLSSFINTMKWEQLRINYQIDDYREVYGWNLKELQILFLQGVQLVQRNELSLPLFLHICSFVLGFPNENTSSLFSKFRCEMTKKFIAHDLQNAEAGGSPFNLFSDAMRTKIKNLKTTCQNESTATGLKRVMESHQNDELYPTFLERHHKRLG